MTSFEQRNADVYRRFLFFTTLLLDYLKGLNNLKQIKMIVRRSDPHFIFYCDVEFLLRSVYFLNKKLSLCTVIFTCNSNNTNVTSVLKS